MIIDCDKICLAKSKAVLDFKEASIVSYALKRYCDGLSKLMSECDSLGVDSDFVSEQYDEYNSLYCSLRDFIDFVCNDC